MPLLNAPTILLLCKLSCQTRVILKQEPDSSPDSTMVPAPSLIHGLAWDTGSSRLLQSKHMKMEHRKQFREVKMAKNHNGDKNYVTH